MADGGGNGNRRAPLQGERLVSLPEAARGLGLGLRQVMRAVEDGKLAAYRVGSQRRVKVCDVETWIDGCRERRR